MGHREACYIFTIAEHGNITKAAEALSISQPALSKYLSGVEARDKVILFKRNHTSLVPTYIGERYIDAARRILAINESLERETRDYGSLRCGKVTMGIPSLEGSMLLPRLIPTFRKLRPDIDLEILEASPVELDRALSESRIDLSLRHLPMNRSPIHYEIVHHDEIMIVAAKNYFRGKKTGVGIVSEIGRKNTPFIALKEGMQIRSIADAFLAQHALQLPTLVETSNVLTAYNLAKSGAGITILPDVSYFFDTHDEVDTFHLAPGKVFYKLALCYQKTEGLTLEAISLIDCIRKLFKALPSLNPPQGRY